MRPAPARRVGDAGLRTELAQDEVQIVNTEGLGLAVATITGISKHGDRYALEGELLREDARAGKPTAPTGPVTPSPTSDQPLSLLGYEGAPWTSDPFPRDPHAFQQPVTAEDIQATGQRAFGEPHASPPLWSSAAACTTPPTGSPSTA
ncbi:hypothetical protein GCM10020367_72360 [Streptomyces sannanensis]|uniref:Uncharacterized protein n=1 Tax=Streptomyces sannanensis TaxID=285536 RepID=A0ABP6SP82_9ACTN